MHLADFGIRRDSDLGFVAVGDYLLAVVPEGGVREALLGPAVHTPQGLPDLGRRRPAVEALSEGTPGVPFSVLHCEVHLAPCASVFLVSFPGFRSLEALERGANYAAGLGTFFVPPWFLFAGGGQRSVGLGRVEDGPAELLVLLLDGVRVLRAGVQQFFQSALVAVPVRLLVVPSSLRLGRRFGASLNLNDDGDVIRADSVAGLPGEEVGSRCVRCRDVGGCSSASVTEAGRDATV